MSTPNTPLQERLAALSKGDRAELARRACVTQKTMHNIVGNKHKPHSSTVRNIERALARFKPTTPPDETLSTAAAS